MSVTHSDIARLSGVSRAAVSQVLKNPDHPRFSAATRRLILDSARQLNHIPNRLASGLREGRTKTIGLVMPFNVPELLDTAQQIANAADHSFVPQFTFKPDPAAERRAILSLLEHRVDGFIWQPSAEADAYGDLLEMIRNSGTHLMYLERRLSELPGDLVYSDTRLGTRLALDHFRQQGFDRVVYLTSDTRYRLRQQRLEEYLAINGGGPYIELVRPDEELLFMADELFVGGGRLGLYCDSDLTGLRVMHLAQDRGLKLPQQVGLIGLGELRIAGMYVGDMIRPGMTTVRRHHDQIARLSTDHLLKRCEGTLVGEPISLSVAPSLVVRSSTVPTFSNSQASGG